MRSKRSQICILNMNLADNRKFLSSEGNKQTIFEQQNTIQYA